MMDDQEDGDAWEPDLTKSDEFRNQRRRLIEIIKCNAKAIITNAVINIAIVKGITNSIKITK